MSSPWDADRTLTREGAAALIQEAFPSVESRGLTFLGCGWEFDAYRTVDGWVVRFPRRAEAAQLLETDRRVTRLVAGFLPPSVSIPRIEHLAEPAARFPYPFGAHRFIPGVPADDVDLSFLPSVARQIGAALGAMHSMPEETARDAGVREDDFDETAQKHWIDFGLAGLSSIRAIDPIVDRAATWVEQTELPRRGYSGPLRFIHQDLSPEHLLVDPSTGVLNGIIDWTDAILGDAARDFVFLVAWRGWPFVEEVLRSYPHPVDSEFRDRLRSMARILTPVWLGLAVQRGTEVEKLTGWVHNAYAPEVHTIRSRGRS